MTSVKRTQRKYVQKAYRVRNWREYETGLRARGSLTVWLGLTDGKLANWNSPRPTRRKPGRQRKVLEPRHRDDGPPWAWCWALASRQTEGFLRSLLTLLNLDNDVPRPQHDLEAQGEAGEGCFLREANREARPPPHRQQRSFSARRPVAHSAESQGTPASCTSLWMSKPVTWSPARSRASGLETLPGWRHSSARSSVPSPRPRPTPRTAPATSIRRGENHRAHRSPKGLIPPRKGAQLALDSAGTRQRHRNIRARSRVGKRKWYVASGYSRRSKVETTFHRYKAILGSAMRARGLASQRVEVRLGCKILNTMTALGIPDGEMIG